MRRLLNGKINCIPWGLSRGLPVFLLLMFGQPLVDSLMTLIPVWLMEGFKIAGGLLPVVGFAILLRYLPVLKKPQFLILGFVLAAYLKIPVLGVGLIGLVAALIVYQNATSAAPATASTSTGGSDYEE